MPDPQCQTTQQVEQLEQQLKLQQSTAQINGLISQSAAALTCGPDCQKTRHSEELKQKYLDAQANTSTAPDQLAAAAKEYYTYTQGEAGYRQYLKTQATAQAQVITTRAQTSFATASTQLEALTKDYERLYTIYTNTLTLYEKYLLENRNLQEQIDLINTDTVTSDRKSFYEGQGVDNLNNWYILLKWIYIILIIIYIFGMILAGSSYSFLTKFLILLAFIIYPFVVVYCVTLLYNGLTRLNNLLPKNAYTTVV
jgi:hypothetical protein